MVRYNNIALRTVQTDQEHFQSKRTRTEHAKTRKETKWHNDMYGGIGNGTIINKYVFSGMVAIKTVHIGYF